MLGIYDGGGRGNRTLLDKNIASVFRNPLLPPNFPTRPPSLRDGVVLGGWSRDRTVFSDSSGPRYNHTSSPSI
jgi:hypothetical protein